MTDEKVISLGNRKSVRKEHEHNEPHRKICCSFCGRENTEVLKMVAGPGVNICSECVMIAVQYLILNDRMPSKEAQKILDAFWGNGNNIG